MSRKTSRPLGPVAAMCLLTSLALLAGCRGPGGGAPSSPFPPSRAGAKWKNSLNMGFVYVPAGDFLMGTSEAEAKAVLRQFASTGLRADKLIPEQPEHRVRITRAFLIGRHEVTVGQFSRFVEATGYRTDAERSGGAVVYNGIDTWAKRPDATWRAPGFAQTDAHPVVCVSWNDAQAFIGWLDQADPRRPQGWAYRLPTEAEWEYAARGSDHRLWAWGSDWAGRRANFADKSSAIPWADREADDAFPRTAPVGSFSPEGDSPFGAADMTGNVWEWCLDWFEPTWYRHCPAADPLNEQSRDERVERGGSWAFTPDYCRTAFRFRCKPDEGYDNLGFRLVLAPALRPEQGRPPAPPQPK